MAQINKLILKYIQPYSTLQGTKWRAAVPDGFGDKFRKSGFLEERDALDWAKQKMGEVLFRNKGVKQNPNRVPIFSEYAKAWLEEKVRNGLATASEQNYEIEIRHRLDPFFGAMKLDRIEKQHLRSFIRECHEDDLGAKVIDKAVSIFKAIIKQAESDDLIPLSGIRDVPTPKWREKAPRFWDESQMRFFLNATKESPNHTLWSFALLTGMRAGEIAGLKFDCVHLDKKSGDHQGFIEVKRAYNQKSKEVLETTKNGDSRVVPILPEIFDLLKKLSENKTGEFVLGGNVPLDSSHFSRTLKKELENLPQLPRIPFHGLRHTFCSYLDSTGLPRRIVSEIMGHRDLNTTNRYSHVSNQVLGNEIAKWAEMQSRQNSGKLHVVGENSF